MASNEMTYEEYLRRRAAGAGKGPVLSEELWDLLGEWLSDTPDVPEFKQEFPTEVSDALQ